MSSPFAWPCRVAVADCVTTPKYSLYGHIVKLAEAEAAGIRAAGGSVDIFQIPETLPQDVLTKLYAGPKSDYPVLSDPSVLEQYDAFLLGIPTRFGELWYPWSQKTLIANNVFTGNFPAQWKAFWDATGKQWQTGAYWGKYGEF